MTLSFYSDLGANELCSSWFFGILRLTGRDGNVVTIGADEKSLNVHLSDEELVSRRANWQPPKPWYSNGMIAKYAKLVSSSSIGASTDGL
ncbi:MAG: dihydroxy-acid dehydratase [Pyrinomonadaceae bacterium]